MDRVDDPRVKPVPMVVEMQGHRIRVPSREECELAAYALLRRHGITRPPVDVYALAPEVGIYDVSVGDLRKAAVAMKVPGVAGVGVILRRHDGPLRRRFSLAHEIGHRVMHAEVAPHVIAPIAARGGYDALERAVNHFAACLLVPRLWVAEYARGAAAVDPDVLVAEVARRFDVSRAAAAVRLREVGISDGGQR